MSALRLGVLGIGDIARNLYLPRIREAEARGRIRLTAVSSRSGNAHSWMAEHYPDVPVHADYQGMLDDPSVDMVVNLTPTLAHASTTLQAIRAGKHVFSEKPLAASLEDADEIISAAAEYGVTVSAAPVIALHPELRRALQWVRKGALGKVAMVRARASHPGPAWDPEFATDPAWFYQPGAGPVLDLAVYPLHVLCLMLGPVQRVTAFAGISYPQREVRSGVAKGSVVEVTTPDNVQMVLDFGDARFASIDATWNVISARGPRMEIYGDKGVLNLYSRPEERPYELFLSDPATGVRGWLEYEHLYRGSLMPAVPDTPTDWSFVDGIEHVAECITTGAQPLASAELGRHILDVCLAALSSAEVGRAVEVSTTFPRSENQS
ncbi:Gfo/Idh/MocA family oxidoreductase [Georgenia halophila]|uniref:Gfo/Idh/MocA family oxidoreductase n=1 Tax=Georgenia halophila TaxID=620889 RepID=A0ABP8LHW8_9MICO